LASAAVLALLGALGAGPGLYIWMRVIANGVTGSGAESPIGQLATFVLPAGTGLGVAGGCFVGGRILRIDPNWRRLLLAFAGLGAGMSLSFLALVAVRNTAGEIWIMGCSPITFVTSALAGYCLRLLIGICFLRAHLYWALRG